MPNWIISHRISKHFRLGLTFLPQVVLYFFKKWTGISYKSEEDFVEKKINRHTDMLDLKSLGTVYVYAMTCIFLNWEMLLIIRVTNDTVLESDVWHL